jgi:hypothetical protein
MVCLLYLNTIINARESTYLLLLVFFTNRPVIQWLQALAIPFEMPAIIR